MRTDSPTDSFLLVVFGALAVYNYLWRLACVGFKGHGVAVALCRGILLPLPLLHPQTMIEVTGRFAPHGTFLGDNS